MFIVDIIVIHTDAAGGRRLADGRISNGTVAVVQPGVESVVPIEIDDGLLVCTVVIVPALLLQGIAVILRSVQRFREIQVRQLYVDLLPAGKLDLGKRDRPLSRWGQLLIRTDSCR